MQTHRQPVLLLLCIALKVLQRVRTRNLDGHESISVMLVYTCILSTCIYVSCCTLISETPSFLDILLNSSCAKNTIVLFDCSLAQQRYTVTVRLAAFNKRNTMRRQLSIQRLMAIFKETSRRGYDGYREQKYTLSRDPLLFHFLVYPKYD